MDRTFYEQIGVAFEFPNHYLKLTARENLQLYASFFRSETGNPDELLEMVNLQDDRHRVLLGQALDDGPNAADSNILSAVNDTGIRGDGDKDAVLLQVLDRDGPGLVDFDAWLFDEHRGDDEKDQEDEYHVDERRDIDIRLLFGGGQ